MNTSRMSKLSASLMVLVMALTAFAVLAGTSEGQTPSGVNIYVPVGSTSGFAVTDAKVNLTELHTGTVTVATYSSPDSSYVVEDAPSGYYRVDVVHANYYDKMNAVSFRFGGFSDYVVNPPIRLTPFDNKDRQWNITVRESSDNTLIPGATVGFYDPANQEFVASSTTNSLGVAVVNMFDTVSLGDVELIVMKSEYETYVEPVLVNGNNLTPPPIYLQDSKRVTGFVTGPGSTASNVVAYLVNLDDSITTPKRILKSLGSFMAFDAYTGNFMLIADADGASAYVSPVTVAGGDVDLTIPSLTAQTQRTDQVSITFGANYNSFVLSVDTVWSYDEAYPGLKYKDMGSLRMQVDLAFGDGNGDLDLTEVGLFYNFVQGLGSQYVSSGGLITVNSTAYESQVGIANYVMDLGMGTVVNTTGVNYAYDCNYNAHESIDIDAPSYTSTVYAKFDSSSVDRVYTVDLPSNYELVWNSTTESSKVNVTGYSPVVTLDSELSATSGSEAVAMELEESLKPIAKAGIVVSDTIYASAIYEDKNISKYIVSVGHNVTLTAAQSSDPNGNPLWYSWVFGDGDSVPDLRNTTVVHNYTEAAQALTVNLTIRDVAGLLNWAEFVVECDGMEPNPVITVKDKPVVDNAIAINQKEVITFNATTSSDDAVADGDELGVIDYVQFFYGDGNASGQVLWSNAQQNVTHSWERSGEFTLVLNVTDVVGRWKNTTLTVKVNDTEAPTINFVVKNATYGTTLTENETLVFDAKGVTDNVATNNLTTMYFSWNFGDNNYTNGTGLWNVTHVYKHVGSFIVKLNVTDLSNNSQVAPKNIQVQTSPRPNMWIDDVTYEPLKKFTEGERGYIIVNITNKGSANATNVTLYFWVVQGDNQDPIGDWAQITKNGTVVVSVAPGETVQARFPWSPDNPGTFTLKVNVTSDNQLKQNQWVGSGLKVDDAPWKDWVLWIGIAAVLIVLPLVIYFRSRLSRVEKKGPRREKKSKGGAEEEL
ncbi:MAG TPA: PKD domain-containing protein [Thermoplasmata archaeon]